MSRRIESTPAQGPLGPLESIFTRSISPDKRAATNPSVAGGFRIYWTRNPGVAGRRFPKR
jgi:hypothetical protein